MSGKVGTPRVKQVDPSLDKPLDKDAPPTIFQTTLEPKYASAALNLSIDFLKQQQGMANKHLIKHPFVIGSIVLCLTIFMLPRLTFPPRFTSVSQYVLHIILLNKRHTFSALIFTVVVSSFLFTLLSRVSDAYFKSKVNEIVKSHGESVFNLNLAEFPAEDKTALNTNIIVYRNTPISLISVSENHILSTLESLVMTVNTIGCRKVYLKSGIIEDLIDWAMLRTRKIGIDQKKTNKSMKLLIEVYSFDDDMKKTLKKKGFQHISSGRVYENRLLGGLFGVKRELWGVQFHVDKPKK